MLVRLYTTIAATSILAVAAGLGGCQRAPDAPAPAASTAAPQPPATSSPETQSPPGVLQAYVWQCENGQTIRMRNLLRENAITIDLHEGGRKLPRVPSASGAKYSDGSLTFWTKGGSALFERSGEAPVDCREDRQQSLLADARVRGVLWRGTGNEPGWTLEVGPAAKLEFVADDGSSRHAFDAAAESVAGARRVFTATDGQRSIKVTVITEACTDDMSGQAFDHRMEVEIDGGIYRGCASALR